MTQSRIEFAERQAEMTARWAEGVHRAHADPEAYFEKRRAAYLDRWMEALRFVPNGSAILDIGGGNGFAALYKLLRSRRMDYWYMDIDPSSVAASSQIAADEGIDPARFVHGYNDRLPHPDAAFDAVFSSHCLEHSYDLEATFSEVHRVLKPGGTLLMAVPFGWELNPEHPYFFGPDEWVALLEDAGFRVRAAHIGSEYPEHGYDYFIAAARIERPAQKRILSEAFTKATYTFLPAGAFHLDGCWTERDGHAIGEAGAAARLNVPSSASAVLPVLTRHAWSGRVQIDWGVQRRQLDCYSWFSYEMPVLVSGGSGELCIQSVGSSPSSRGAQVVVHGIMYR